MVSWPKDPLSEELIGPSMGRLLVGLFLNSTSGMLNGGEAGVDVRRLLSSITYWVHHFSKLLCLVQKNDFKINTTETDLLPLAFKTGAKPFFPL